MGHSKDRDDYERAAGAVHKWAWVAAERARLLDDESTAECWEAITQMAQLLNSRSLRDRSTEVTQLRMICDGTPF